VTTWVYAPPWGIRGVAAVGAALLALLVLRALRERRSARLRRQVVPLVLRLAAIAGLLVVALNPTALIPQEIGGKPKLIVLIDTSASMATRDVDGKSRLEAALGALGGQATFAALSKAFAVDVRSFDRESRAADLAQPATLQATGRASDVASALIRAIDDVSESKAQAGVLLVSDGRATTEGAADAARLALARSVPLWTWCLGGEVARRDLWFEVGSTEALAFAGAEVELVATLHQVGYPQRSFTVELLSEGKSVAAQEAVPDASGAVRVAFRVTAPAAGEHRYVFRAPPQSDEAETANNERSVFLRVVGEKVRVLVAEGEPHWDTKFLVQCLKRSPRVDLTAVYRLGAERQFAVVSSEGEQRRETGDFFPRTPEAMMAYDIVIFGRGSEAFFGPGVDQLLTDFVARRGGGLIFARGKAYGGRFLPMARLEPVVWGGGLEQDVRLRVTEAGRESPVFELGASAGIDDLIARFPALDRATATVGEKPLAVVFATADGEGAASPAQATIVMAYQRYGQGKVVTLNASGLWRWAFREKGKDEEEFVYSHFWNSLLRWMLSGAEFLPGADVALRSSRRTYTDEQPLQFLITTKGLDRASYRPRLTVSAGGQPVEVEPRESRGGAYVAEVGPFPEGTYQVMLKNNVGKPAELATTIEVVSASVENRVLSADPATMERLASLSDGQRVAAADVADLPGIVRRWRAARQVSSRKASLWDRWWLLGGVLAAMGIEWFLRRREGLL